MGAVELSIGLLPGHAVVDYLTLYLGDGMSAGNSGQDSLTYPNSSFATVVTGAQLSYQGGFLSALAG